MNISTFTGTLIIRRKWNDGGISVDLVREAVGI